MATKKSKKSHHSAAADGVKVMQERETTEYTSGSSGNACVCECVCAGQDPRERRADN